MLDIRFIIENSNKIKESEKRRGKDTKIVDEVIGLDKQWKSLKLEVDKLRQKRNNFSKEINQLKKQRRDISPFIKQAKEIPKKILEIEKKSNILLKERDILRYKIGNVLHKSVPLKDKVVRTVGKKTVFKGVIAILNQLPIINIFKIATDSEYS